MINLIFTRKSLLAGVKAESADLLNFDEHSSIEFGNRSMREALEDSIPQIVEKYADYAKTNNIVLNGSIPATLVFPVETTAREVHEIMHFVGSYSDVKFNIIHIDDLIQPFLHGQAFSKEDMKEPMIILEGLDDYLSVVYYFNTEEVKHQSFITFEEKQAENHGQHIIDALVREFNKIGFSLSEDDQKELRYQHTLNNSTYFIQKSNGVATLSASVRREDLVMDKSASIDKYTLSRVLNKERLENLGVKKVVLIGDHLIDYGYPQYLQEDLGLGNMVYIPVNKAAEESFLTIIKGVENRTSSPFQPDLKVAEVLNPPSPEQDFLDLSKLNAQLKPEDLAAKLGIKPQELPKVEAVEQEEKEKGGELMKIESDLPAVIEEEPPAEEKAKESESHEVSEDSQAESTAKTETANEKNTDQANVEIQAEEKEKPQTDEEVASIEILKRSLARLANKPLRDGTKEANGAISTETVEETAQDAVAKEERNISKEETKLPASPKLEEKAEPKVEQVVEEKVVAKIEKASEEKVETKVEQVIGEKVELKEPVLVEAKLEVSPKAEPQKKEIESKGAVEEKKEATPTEQAIPEDFPEPILKKVEQPEKTEEAPVSSLATSPQTGIEEWNRISEMEETLKRHEEEERKKFEMLKEKLALQRQQKAQKLAEKPEVPNVPRKNARSINLKEAFEFIKNFPEEEFITQMVLDKNLRAKKVLRFVSNADFAQSYIEYKFLRLYDKESRYYPGISGLYESEEGKFYMRNYYKGSTLAEYASKAGLAKKHSLKKLSSSDLEFIVKVIDEVNDSPVSHSNLHANNIIVQEKGFWRFNTVEQIRLVGFTSDDCSKEDMLNRVHEIFHALLAPGVYSEFRNTLKL